MDDENWIYGYDLETKLQSSQWKGPNSPREKRCGRSGVQQRACPLVFLTWRVLLTMNLFFLTLQSTLTVTVTFWYTWEEMCDEKDWNFGATTTGFFITTTRLPTCPWKPQSLWQTAWLLFPILPARWTWPLCFPNWKWNWGDDVLKQCLASKGIASGTRQH
jgi:hypothetical protein